MRLPVPEQKFEFHRIQKQHTDAAGLQQHLGPPSGYMWLLLYGTIEHTTATDTNVSIVKMGSTAEVDAKLCYVPAANGTATYPWANMGAVYYQGQFPFALMSSDQRLYITSGNTALNFNVAYLQFKVHDLDLLMAGRI